MPYDLTRIGPDAFEKLAQALAAHELGPGAQIYGAGPDGAREVTFDGPTNISTNGHTWNGYIVVQAKCRTSRNSISDASWLKQELQEELRKFTDPRRQLRRPDYYLVVTNVTLSPAFSPEATGRGGIQLIEDYLQTWTTTLGIRGSLVWHADAVATLLDKNSDIRTCYAAWITPGDVLSAMLASIKRPDAAKVLQRALNRDIRRDRDIRRKDAGQVTDRKIFLDDVFVDLPLTVSSEQPRAQVAGSAPPDADQTDTVDLYEF